MVLSLPVQACRETDAEGIGDGADDLDLGGLGASVVQHGRTDGTDELTAGRHGLYGDDGEGFIDLTEVNLRGRHHGGRQT